MATVTSESEPGLRRWLWTHWPDGIAILWLAGYALFFFHFTLPNSNPPTSRVEIWLELPEFLWANVVTPPRAPASSWANLAQRCDLLAVACAIWLGSWGVGGLCLRALRIPLTERSAERFVSACGVGLSAVSLLTLACGLSGWLSPVLLGGLLLLAFVGELMWSQRTRDVRPPIREVSIDDPTKGLTPPVRQRSWWEAINGVIARGEQIPYGLVAKGAATVAIGLFLMAMLLGSLLPPTDFDVKAYHLTGPKEYFLNGRITFLEHNVYTNFPFLTEMLCLLGMVLRQDWYRGALAGQAVLMGFAPLTGLALFCAGRRWFGATAGWLASLIYLSTPWTYRLAIIAYVEGALSCYLFLALFALLLARDALRCNERRTDSARLILLAGLFAGSAMACKYPGLVSVVVPIGIACVAVTFRGQGSDHEKQTAESRRQRSFRQAACLAVVFSIGTAVAIGPWLLKNLVATGNPVYPLAYGLFGGRDWDAASHAKWRAGHSPSTYALSDLAEKFIDVTAKADWLSPLLFSLAPLALIRVPSAKCQVLSEKTATLALSTRHLALFLWLYVAYLFLQWWLLTHRIDRFWVPMIPVVALLAGAGCEWSLSKLWRRSCGVFVALSVLFNLGFVTTRFCGFNAYLSDLAEAREASEGTSEAIHYLNQLTTSGKLAADAKVLCVGEAEVFAARPPVLYNTVFDQPILRDWLAKRPAEATPERDWPLRPIADVRQRFESAGVTHVLVNWQELLRYRRTYGYSDFVTPQRFRWLQEQGLLGAPAEFGRPYAELSPEDQREVEQWAPELKATWQGRPTFVAWQWFAVQRR